MAIAKNPIQTDVSYIFKIQRIKEPIEFRNLWALKMDLGNGFETVVDADSLSLVVDKIGHVLETDGF
jgi:hypothetical protein